MNGDRIEPVWIDAPLAIAIHDRQLAEHGGLAGLRDRTMLESALARPINRWHYGEDERAVLAAAHAFGIAQNHPFADGNKRTAWVAARLFLRLNAVVIRFDAEDATRTVLALAAGELSEDDMADWFRRHIVSG